MIARSARTTAVITRTVAVGVATAGLGLAAVLPTSPARAATTAGAAGSGGTAISPARAATTFRVGQTATLVEKDCGGRCKYHWGFVTRPNARLVRISQGEGSDRHAFHFTALEPGTATAEVAYFPPRLGLPITGRVRITLTITR